jgi:hypothetical protein
MAKAKTASKNNPSARIKAKEIFFNGRKVVPVLFVGSNSKYMSAQYEDSGDLAMDESGLPIKWASVL